MADQRQSTQSVLFPVGAEEQYAILSRGIEESFPENELLARLKRAVTTRRPLRVKLGVDPTAKELHLGHLVPVLKLRQFQELGHKAVLIIGDYTATVGDPSGRNKTRPQLSHGQVMEFARTYQDQVFRILDPALTEVVYNGAWFSRLEFSEVIRLLSKMTLARMLEREDFHNRFAAELPISLHELVYPLMQGYDSVAIRADVELGGTDQKFNILVGRDLQREAGLEPQVGVSVPILLGTDGVEKMSKSLGNTIAIDDPAAEKYGKVMSIPDTLMKMYFELLTEVPLDEVGALMRGVESGEAHPRDVKRRLAREVVSRFDGPGAVAEAEARFDRVFTQREAPDDVPDFQLNPAELRDGKIWIARLIVQAGLASSNGEARRLVVQGGVRLAGEPVTDPDLDWQPEPGVILKVGRRKFVRVVLATS